MGGQLLACALTKLTIDEVKNVSLYPVPKAREFYARQGFKQITDKDGDIQMVFNLEYEHPVHVAAEKNDVVVLRAILKHGGPLFEIDTISENGRIALHIAATKGHDDIARALLEYKVNVNSVNNEEETALHIAAAKGHEDIARLLLEKGADVNQVFGQVHHARSTA